jgi:UDP-glucose 4-epimerase
MDKNSLKCLITGGAGFIGSHLSDQLIQKGHKVVVIDSLFSGKKVNVNKKAKFYKIDIRNPLIIPKIFKKEKPEIVFHLAAQINVRESAKNPLKDAEINILGGINILENCRINKVKKVIFASTGGAMYGNANVIPTPETYLEFPLSPYGIAKLTTEKYLNYYHKVFGLSFVALRFANVYGPRQNSKGEAGVVAIFCDKMLNKQKPVIFGNGKQTRDFVYVDDVVSALILAMNSKKTGIFNIGTAKETDINNLLKKIKVAIGSNLKEIYKSGNAEEQKKSCLDYSKAKNELNWKPKHNLDQGLIKTIEWFKQKNGK